MDRRTFITSAVAIAASPFGARPAPAMLPVTFDLNNRIIEVNGRAASVLGILQPDGTPGLLTEVTQPFRVQVRNRLNRESLIHWHGLTPPFRQDGVPYISAPPIKAGDTQN